MYGLPKLMEFDKTRSPGQTRLVLDKPSGRIRSSVEVMYLPISGASPIFTQFSPFGSSVMNASIGLGEPPRSIRASSLNLRCSQSLASACWIDTKLEHEDAGGGDSRQLGNSVGWGSYVSRAKIAHPIWRYSRLVLRTEYILRRIPTGR